MVVGSDTGGSWESVDDEGVLLAGVFSVEERGLRNRIYFSPPVRTLKFGISVGVEWTVEAKDEARLVGKPRGGSVDWVIQYKVEGTETITTPAGEFECFRVLKTTDPGTREEAVERLWYGKGVGLVKSKMEKPRSDAVVLLDYQKPHKLREDGR